MNISINGIVMTTILTGFAYGVYSIVTNDATKEESKNVTTAASTKPGLDNELDRLEKQYSKRYWSLYSPSGKSGVDDKYKKDLYNQYMKEKQAISNKYNYGEI